MRGVSSLLLATCFLLPLVGCRPPADQGTLSERIQAKAATVRLRACVEAGQTGNREAMPLLVDRLSDVDADVRMFAHLALKQISGKDFDWKPWDTEAARGHAVDRWRAWLAVQHQAHPPKAKGPTP